MRLEILESASVEFVLHMNQKEWTAVQALAEFAKAGIAYDAHAAYVAQVFTYVFLQPRDLVQDSATQRAFSAVDGLSAAPRIGDEEAILRLPKAEMRQMLMMLAMAAESEDQSEIIHGAMPNEFPHVFPDLELPSSYYANALNDLLSALYTERALTVECLSNVDRKT